VSHSLNAHQNGQNGQNGNHEGRGNGSKGDAQGDDNGSDDDQYGHKVVICHHPPGNPDNAHTITVDQSAVPAHLAHGDTLGPCPPKSHGDDHGKGHGNGHGHDD
jgi:hypothetical protein